MASALPGGLASAASAGGAGESPPVRRNADMSDWLAVAAGTIGALMATLDISIVNAALPIIQGSIGATGTEATWVATSFLVAEIVVMPLSGWLTKLLGLRRFLLIAATLFIGFSVLCGIATNLTMMIIGRAGQGAAGGAMIPTTMAIIASRLPSHQQPIGTAAFGVTAIMGPIAGPVLGGWLTEAYSWHYAFLINVPVCGVLIALLIMGLPKSRARIELIADADWLGIVGMTMFLAGMTIVLEEGNREQWFQSAEIVWLTIASVAGLAMLIAGQITSKDPVIRLRLLYDRQFSGVILMGIVIGMVIYGTSFVIPQFLSAIAGYDALQAGLIVSLSGLPPLAIIGLTPILMRIFDIRVAVGLGMVFLILSAWLDTTMTTQSVGGDFIESQLLRGLGMVMSLVFLNQAAISAVPVKYAGDAAGLFNTARNLGGSLALAAIATVQEQRVWFHTRRIEETLSANAVAVQDRITEMAATYGSSDAALRVLSGTIAREALVMTYNDMFFLLSIVAIVVAPLVLVLRPLPSEISSGPMH